MKKRVNFYLSEESIRQLKTIVYLSGQNGQNISMSEVLERLIMATVEVKK